MDLHANRDPHIFNKFNHFLLCGIIPRSQFYAYYFSPGLLLLQKFESLESRSCVAHALLKEGKSSEKTEATHTSM